MAPEMNTTRYLSGETVELGDRVHLAGHMGRIIAVGDELLAWGLSSDEISEGLVMIESEFHGTICQNPDCEDLILISRFQPVDRPNQNDFHE